MTKNLSQFVNVRISEKQREVLERRAEELGGTLGAALRAIITEYGREHYENGNDKHPQEQTA